MMESGQLDIVDYKKDDPDLRALDHLGLIAALRDRTEDELTGILIERGYSRKYLIASANVRRFFLKMALYSEDVL